MEIRLHTVEKTASGGRPSVNAMTAEVVHVSERTDPAKLAVTTMAHLNEGRSVRWVGARRQAGLRCSSTAFADNVTVVGTEKYPGGTGRHCGRGPEQAELHRFLNGEG
jgi:hypothetical protein